MEQSMYDAADEACAVNREPEERAIRFIRWALANGGDEHDAHAACWLAGLKWDDVKINGRLQACIPSAANESEEVAGSRPA